jgi:SAM-dependent methyltransferase
LTALTETQLVNMLAEAARRGMAPLYVPAFFSGLPQPTLSDLGLAALEGKSLLDVGSNIGLRCFEAAQRGASRVVGLDVNPDRVQQARALATMLGLDIEFRCIDVDVELPDESADVVICSSVLNRSAAPIALLQRLAARTRQQLILYVAGPEAEQFARLLKDIGVKRWQARLLQRLPIMLVGRGGPTIRWPESRNAMTAASIRHVLLYQNAGFADADIRVAKAPGHFYVTATRRRIGHLLVISGISGVGKTTFVNWLKANPGEAERLFGIADFASWPIIEPLYYPELAERNIPRLCLHNDLSRGLRHPARGVERDVALQLLNNAERITCLTLWAPAPLVKERKRERMLANERVAQGLGGLLAKLPAAVRQVIRADGFSRTRAARWRAQQEWDQQALAGDELMQEQYRRWIAHCERIGVDAHWVVDTSSAYEPIDAREFAHSLA